MAIRFKFRSSANFDSVFIEDGRPCISVGDLKSRIRSLKNLNIGSGSDLRISDASTGEEYRDDNVQIPSGSSVIIKRVPAGPTLPLAIHSNDVIENRAIKDINPGVMSSPDDKDRTLKKPSLSVKEDIIDFDDFGDDVCPVLERMVDDFSFNVEKKCSISCESPNVGAARCNKLTMELGQISDDSDHSEAVSRGPLAMVIGRDKLLVEVETKTEEPSKLQKNYRAINASFIATQNADLPSELKCSLCHAPYDEAVMIPCCQNSFCERCIRPVLNEKSCCPNCSAKCRPEDLLPNVSVRRAVEICLRAQVLADGLEDVHHHAPDGESGIQGKEASGDLTVVKRASECCQPSKVTGKGPGHIISESAPDWKSRNKAVTAGSCSNIDATERARQIYEEEVDSSCPVYPRCENLVVFPDSKVKSQSMPEQGGDVNLLETGRDRKMQGCRACYMCGSLHHLIRNCPHASTLRPMPQRGNSFFPESFSPFGNASHLLHVRPFVDQFVNFGMMPLNTAVIPAAPLSVPLYMSSIYGGLPTYGRLGSMAPVAGVGTGPNHSFQELNDLHNREKQWELAKKYTTKDTSTDFGVDDGFIRRSHLVNVERCQKEDSFIYSDDSFSQKPQREHRHGHNLDSDIRQTDERHQKTSHSSTSARDGRLYYRERISSPEAEDVPSCSSRRAKERHYHRNKESKMHKENMARFSSDSSWSHCEAEKRMDVKRKRDESNVKRPDKKPCSSELDYAHKSASDKENRMRDKQSSHRPGESGHLQCRRNGGRSVNDDLIQYRWKMVSGSDEDDGGRPHHYKRNKVR